MSKFHVTRYPVILSIENHCTPRQQRVMARKFVEIFGRMLLTQSISRNETSLPSPEQLKKKIILKCKMQRSTLENNSTNNSIRKDNNSDISKTCMSGKMYILNSNLEWKPFFFAIASNNKLVFTEIPERPAPAEDASLQAVSTETFQ